MKYDCVLRLFLDVLVKNNDINACEFFIYILGVDR